MKKILSITTALASLVAFYGVNVLADSSVEVEQSKQNVNKEIEQNKQKNSSGLRSNEDQKSEDSAAKMSKAKTKLEEREKRVCGKEDKACGCKHNASFKEGPRITIGGGFNTQFHKTSDVKDFDVIPGDAKFADPNAVFGEFGNGLVGDYSKTSGSSVDTVLNIRAENTNYDLGLAYGADVKLNVPITKSGGMRSRSAHIFTNTEFGDINVGFMEGAESIMRLDASKIAAGDGGADSSWFKKAHLEGYKGNFPFYVTPRLYSESLFSESNWLSFRDSVKYNKSLIDTQPFRVSYFSPAFMGLKFGASYSPNYDSDLFATGGMQKVKYIDPIDIPGTNVKANFYYKWYNTANAALKAARALNDVGVTVTANANASLAAAAAASTAADAAYNEARTYNANLPEIPAAIADPAQVAAAAGVNIDLVIADAGIRALATNVVTARHQNAATIAANAADDATRLAARNTVIAASKAVARIAALALDATDTQINPNPAAVVNQEVHDDRGLVIDQNDIAFANGPLHMALSAGVADGVAIDGAPIAAGGAAVVGGGDDAQATLAKTQAQNTAIIAFRAAATAQSALGVNIGTAKEFYTLLATSGNYVGPNYENIVSGGISYDYDFDDFKIKVSATGEKGQVKEIKGDRYGMYGKYNDLAAFNLGLSAEYFGFKFAASYANLGKSGQPKEICVMNTTSNKYDCKDDKVKDLQKDTYYWTIGSGYEFGNAYVSATYFKSKSAEANELSDIVIGAEYNLAPSGSKNPLVPYVTWHHFDTNEKDLPANRKNNKGDIFLVGVKHSF